MPHITRYENFVVAKTVMQSHGRLGVKSPTWVRTTKGRKLMKFIDKCIKQGGYVEYYQHFDHFDQYSVERANVTLHWCPSEGNKK